MLNDLRFRLRALLQGRRMDRDLNDELRFHVEREIDKRVASGLSREDAERRVRLAFGGRDQVAEECRDARGVHLVETSLQDVRYGLRTLRRSPGFAAVALLTLALGIGANTAIFSVVYGVLLRPLPYREPSRLVVLNETTPRVGLVSVSYQNFLDWRRQSRAFSELSVVADVSFNLAGVGQPENIMGQAVSPGFLAMMGVRPLLGRDFDPAGETPGAARVVLLGYDLWQSHFGGDAGAVGRTITLDGVPVTVIGVLPPDYLATAKTDVVEPIGVWVKDHAESANDRGDRGDMAAVGRLAPGLTLQQARAEMETIAARLAQQYPGANALAGVSLRPVRDVFVSDVRPAILVLSGAAAFVLLIACANVANLLLMRGAARVREIALRVAIGASRGRVVRQLLAESLVLASFGGLVGVALAAAGIHGLARLVPLGNLPSSSVRVSPAVLAFAVVAAVVSTCLFGLMPALRSAKTGVQPNLKDGGRSGSAAHTRWRGLLVMVEVSLALTLLVGAGLMTKSLARLLSVDPGFRSDHLLVMSMSLRTAKYDNDAVVAGFWREVLDRVSALPGVEAAALGSVIPLTNDHSRTDITVEGMALPKPGGSPHPDVHTISPGYVRTLGMTLIRGRVFTQADTARAPLVALVNASVATHLFAGESPVGKRFVFGRPSGSKPPRWVTIVGEVGDTKLYGLDNPSRLEVYIPLEQDVSNGMNLVVRTGNDAAAQTTAVRQVVAALDPDQPVFAVSTMGQLVDASLSARHVTFLLLSWFSGLAVVLAAMGIYGVMSYSVAQRTREIGIRIALGATRRNVLGVVLTQGATMAGAGVVLGIVVSFGLARLMSSLLYSVSAADPATFGIVAAVLAAVAMLACYIPSRRVLGVDPMTALRDE